MNGIRILFAAVVLCSIHVGPATVPVAGQSRDATLTRVLTGRNEVLRLRTLHQLQSDPRKCITALDDLVTAAGRLVNETPTGEVVRPSTAELVQLIGSVDRPEAEIFLVSLLDSPHPAIAMLSADVLGKNRFHGAIEFLKRQVDRPEFATHYGFRFNLVRALAQMEHPDAIEFLSQLQTGLDGQLKFATDNVLAEVAEADFRGDRERFAQWQQSRRTAAEAEFKTAEPSAAASSADKIVFQPAGYQPESLNKIRFERPQYYGIDIHAKRMMFIIDHSGSMKDYTGGMTRLDRAKSELTRAIQQLPPDCEFSILFYETAVRRWRSELVVASDENKQDAIAFTQRLGYGDRTNTHGALREALQFDDQLEAVYLLTDGKPTAGEIVAPAAIIQDVLHRNRFRHLNFNTIGIAVSGGTEQFLKTLAEHSAGEFRHAQ